MIDIGTKLQDRFLVEAQIGIGGMGAVYRATDEKFGTVVAIKETLYRDTDLAEAFEREARLLNGLHHPLFPHVSDHFVEGGGHFLVMEFIEGEDLSELLKRGERFPFETVARWTMDLLDGIDYLHLQDPPIIHRDIKPSNIKLTPRGNIMLLDFGMAKETSGHTLGMKSVFGYSRRYSPLEQIEGTGTDVRSDIFSLGATVYHLLTGEAPIDVLKRASAIVAGRPDPLPLASSVNTEVPEEISVMINSALALNPDERFASARELWSAFELSLHGRSRSSAIPPLPAEESASAPSPEPGILTPADASFPALTAFVQDGGMEGVIVAEKAEPSDDEPFRIQVPVGPLPDSGDSNAGSNASKEDEANVSAVPAFAMESTKATVWYRKPALAAIVPLLILVVGVAGYLVYQNGQDVAAQNSTVDQNSLPENGTTAEPKKQEQTASANTRAATSAERQRTAPGPDSEVSPDTPPADPQPDDAERNAEKDTTAASRRSRRTEDQGANDEPVFEDDPPVSSIESVMTGEPPVGQRERDRIVEEEIKRERRQRRIERRNNRRRQPLF
jgi:serine/threonine protein kinase